MKILLIGDASNCHRALASGLRRLGCDVVVASAGSGFMNTDRDINIRRPLPGKAGGLLLSMMLNGPLRSRMKGFDIVSCANCNFVDLRPERIRKVFNHLRANNGSVFLTYLGTDLPFIEECLDPASPLRYSEFRQKGQPGPLDIAQPWIIKDWKSAPLADWCNEFYANIDGAVSVLYEYHLAATRRLPPEKIAYGGIPIETDNFTPVDLPSSPSPVRIFLGRHKHRMAVKGTDRFETAIRRAMERNPGKAELVIVENRPYDEYIRLMKSAHIVVDQAYSYTPATNALLSMAYGIPTVSGGEPQFYDFIGQPATPGIIPPATGIDGTGYSPGTPDPLRPVINSPIDTDGMTEMFCDLINHPEYLRATGIASRRFVEAHNEAETVARRFLSFWESRLNRTI